jgi:hypothetical protein
MRIRWSDASTCLLVKPQGMQMTPKSSKIQTTQAFSTSHVYRYLMCRKKNINLAVPSIDTKLITEVLKVKGQEVLGLKDKITTLLSKLEKRATAHDC